MASNKQFDTRVYFPGSSQYYLSQSKHEIENLMINFINKSKHQLYVILLLYSAFFIGGLNRSIINGFSFGRFFRFSIVVFSIFLIFFLKELKDKVGKSGIYILPINLKKAVRCNADKILLCCLVIVARVPQWGTIIRNDSAAYYDAMKKICDNFGISLSYIKNNFFVAGHKSIGAVFLFSILEFINPDDYHNIWIYQTTLSCITVMCVYALIIFFIPGLNQWKQFFLAFMFSCCPMFMGLDSYFTLDFSMACFFFWILTSYFYRKDIFFFFSMFLLVSTREMSIVALLGLYMGCFFYQAIVVRNGTILKRLSGTFKEPFFALFTIMVFFAFLYSIINLFSHGGAVDVASSYGSIAFDWKFIQSKFKGYLCSNFMWLCSGITATIFFFKKKIHRQKSVGLLLVMTSSTTFLYAVALALFQTFTLLRYQILIEMIIVFNCTIVLGIYWLYFSSQVISVVSLTILLSTQSMLTINPVMLHVYRHIHNNGKFPMITSEENSNSWIGDYSIYNYQYSYLDRCIQKLLVDFNYNGNIDFLNFNYERGLLIGYCEAKSYGWNRDRMEFSTEKSSDYIPLYYYSWLNDGTRIEQQELLDDLHEYAVIFISEDYPNNVEEMWRYLLSHYDHYEEMRINDGLYGSIHVFIAHNKRYPLTINKEFNSYIDVGDY